MEPRLKPPPYGRRVIRYNWDRSDTIIPIPPGHTVVYPNSASGTGYTGTAANISDPALCGVAPLDPTPETYDGIYSVNSIANMLTLGFPVIAGGAGRMWMAAAFGTCKNGVVAPVPGSTGFELKIKAGNNPLIWKRSVNIPANMASLWGVEYAMNPAEMNLGGIDLSTVQVTFQPFNMSGSVACGLYVSYFHFRFAPPE